MVRYRPQQRPYAGQNHGYLRRTAAVMSPLGSSSLTLMTEPETADGQEQMMSTSGSGNTWLRSPRQPLGLRSPQALAHAVTRPELSVALRGLYWSVPAIRLHDAVARHAGLGAALLPAVPEAARPSLAAAVAESSLLAGRLEFFDLQQPETAQASYVAALQAAQEARDPLLGSASLAHMALIPAFSGAAGRAEEARDKMRAARAFARRGPAAPGMPAWPDTRGAEG